MNRPSPPTPRRVSAPSGSAERPATGPVRPRVTIAESLVLHAQAALARYLPPGTGSTVEELVDELLDVLDSPEANAISYRLGEPPPLAGEREREAERQRKRPSGR